MSGDRRQPAVADASSTSGGAAVELVIVDGPDAGRCFDLAGVVVLGRDRSAGIVVDDPEVSRKHASLAAHADGVEIEDLGSRNGTFVHGERIAACRLTGGDRLRVGSTVLEVRVPGRGGLPQGASGKATSDDSSPVPKTRPAGER